MDNYTQTQLKAGIRTFHTTKEISKQKAKNGKPWHLNGHVLTVNLDFATFYIHAFKGRTNFYSLALSTCIKNIYEQYVYFQIYVE